MSDRIPSICADQYVNPPNWAIQQRRLIDLMNQAGVFYANQYVRSDNTLIWKDSWPGMDGSDDAYESFWTFPLFYLVGGSEQIHQMSRQLWDSITWQFTEYGQIYREFDAYYDWMHHGESYSYLYYLGLCDPFIFKDRQRARRFASFYLDEDPEAKNYDPDRKLIRSPLNGSRGPRLEMSREDWSTHRDVLSNYPAPYEDIPGVETEKANWNDDETFTVILELLNQRMAKGDVPLNLTATSLILHAFAYDNDIKYEKWILDYLGAWQKRTEENHGIIPDNIGLNGEIGENMNGKWWGGYYGWYWPHGATNLLESTLISGCNALMLTGNIDHLNLARSQQDLLWSLGKNQDGNRIVPFKHTDNGWDSYRLMPSNFPIQLWNVSESEVDLERVNRLTDSEKWLKQIDGRDDNGGWFRFVRGEFPEFPERVLAANIDYMNQRLEMIENDNTAPETWDVHHWQTRNPVWPQGLLQLTTGGPTAIYHGGLLNCRIRHFDLMNKRAGLPEDVSALVDQISECRFRLQLINLNPLSPRSVVSLAGAFGEHQFKSITIGKRTISVDSKWLQVDLQPRCGITLEIKTDRFVNPPRYDFPWCVEEKMLSPIQLRTPNIDPGSVPVGG